jgi:phosphohistidine phosphatase
VDLYIMRHGEAGKRLGSGAKDSERSLTVMGQKEVQEVARALSWLDEKIDLVVTSPLKRSAQTAQIVAKELKLKKGAVEEWDELKPEGNRAALLRKLSQFKQESSVLVIGHEPYLSTMISEIVSGTSSGGIVLKKAGLARIGVTSLRPKVKGELRWLLTPRHLKKMAK